MVPANVGKKIAPNYANLFLAEWEEKSIRKLRPKTLSILEVLGWYFYDLGTLQGRILQIKPYI